ncbi:hypothetical protein [Pseudoalteromonas sp. HL-AS1]|uniref:hypothetical protein n=1 Tax=Pseudoalteromonas sp. HL-AS1 TaxID=3071081 RepID=UPI002816428F|nr:hypothetical protein [Pseudoalteromonas sp. HL-AS1]WMS92920.1 hypothetical protein RB214_17505 [Pseudoalteromonas sp. HL-AS1]
MSLQFSDLDELLSKVRNTHAKKYFNEAIVAYRAGAYRASVISTWIAICVDVIEKVRELSVSNDAVAKAIEIKLEAIQPNNFAGMQAFEKDILTYACDELEIISHIEKAHLERIKDDRNVCAHPTFSADGRQFTPSPELTRAYIVQAANYLLLKLPMKGKVIVQDIFNLINEESFPEDDEKAFTVLSSDKYLGRVRDSSARNLTIILLKRIFKDEDGLDPSLLTKISVSLGAISRIFPIVYSGVIQDKLSQMLAETDDRKLIRCLPFLNVRPEIWGKIDEAIVVRLDSCISNMDLETMLHYQVTDLADKIHAVNLLFLRAIKKDSFDSIAKLLKSTPYPSLKNEAINYFVKSGSFASAYSNGMNILLPYSRFMEENDLKVLFKGVMENGSWGINQILDAGGIDEVFSNLYINTKDTVINHSEIWLEFIALIKAKELKYKSLTALLISDGLIKADVKKEDVRDQAKI